MISTVLQISSVLLIPVVPSVHIGILTTAILDYSYKNQVIKLAI